MRPRCCVVRVRMRRGSASPFTSACRASTPAAYGGALRLAAEAAALSGVAVDIIDVGGGFPVSYADTVPPPLDAFIAALSEAATLFPADTRLWAEPGRALVAGGGSVVAQVQLR